MLPNLNSHNHNQHAGRPCFSLAVQIERSKSTPRYDISLLRNRASHVSAHAIHAHADWSLRHRSTTAEPSCAGCKQSARRATRMTIGRHCMHHRPLDLLSRACRFYFRSSFNCRSARAPQNFAFVPIFSREPSFLLLGLSYMKDLPSERADSPRANWWRRWRRRLVFRKSPSDT
jgi:hypothetical protein